jgi:hypothetical protein
MTLVVIYIEAVYKSLENGTSEDIHDPLFQISNKHASTNENPIEVIEVSSNDSAINKENCSSNEVSVSLSAINVDSNDDNINIDTNANSVNIVNDLISKLFWTCHFGTKVYSVKWDLFAVAFMATYGYHNLHVMRRLKIPLCSANDTVSILHYSIFCNNDGGLRNAFQIGKYH